MWFELRRESLAFCNVAPVRHVNEAELAAAPAEVFAAIADPSGWKRWFPGVREASYASPPPFGAGTIRRAHVGATHWVEEMIAWEPPVLWAYTVTHATVPFAWAQVESFELEPAGAGTRVRWTIALEPRLLARLGAPFAPRTIRGLFHRAMRNLDLEIAPAAK